MTDKEWLNQTQQINLSASSTSQLDLAFIQSDSDRQQSQNINYSPIKKQFKYQTLKQNEDNIFSTPLSKCYFTQSMKKQKGHLLSNNTQQLRNTQKTAEMRDKTIKKMQGTCAICLNKLNKLVGNLVCGHQYCYECIIQWCKTSTRCPCCRKDISTILKITKQKNKIIQSEVVHIQQKQWVVQNQYDLYICYVCGSGDDQHVLLICDRCDINCCHVYCDQSLNGIFPTLDWHCLQCKTIMRSSQAYQNQQQQSQQDEKQQILYNSIANRTRSRQSNSFQIINNARNLRQFRRRRI